MIALYRNAGPKTFEVFRAVVFGLWFLNLLWTPLSLLSEVPPDIYNPIGIPLKFFPAMNTVLFQPVFLVLFKWVMTGVLFLAACGIFPRFSSLAGSVMLTLEQAFLRGFGYVNHAEIPLLYAAYIVTFALFVLPKKTETVSEKSFNPYQVPFVLFLLLFLLTYTMIGIHRVAFGGLEVFTTGRMINWIAANAYNVSYYTVGWGQKVLEWPMLQQFFLIGFPISTVFEILAPLALIHPFFRKVFLFVIYPFHLMNWLFMDLFFLESMVVLVLLFDMSRWLEPKSALASPVVFYDGVCGLCDRFVQWTLARDSAGVLAYAPLQGQIAASKLGTRSGDSLGGSIIFYDTKNQTQHERSGAIARILMELGGLWKIAGALLWLVPVPLRDGGYRLVAANRYRLFGKYEVCRLPQGREKERFLP